MPSIKLPFHKGLMESQEPSMIPVGSAALLENWIPESSGALRARVGLTNGPTTGSAGTRRTRSITHHAFADVWQTPARVQSVTDDSASKASNPEVTFSATVANNLLVVGVVLESTTETLTAPSASWKLAATLNDNVTRQVFIYYLPNASSTTSVVFTQSGAGSWWAWGAEYSGIATTDPFDGTASVAIVKDGSNKVIVPKTSALSQVKELAVAVGATTQASTNFSAPENGFAEVTEVARTGNIDVASWQKVTAGAAPQQLIFTSAADAADIHTVVVATFKAAAATSPTAQAKYVVSHDTTSQYSIYETADTLAGSYTKIEDVTSSSRALGVAFASGAGVLAYTHPNFSSARYWDGTTAAAITNGPSARALVYHLGRFYAGGVTSNPSRLYYSDILDATSWPTENHESIEEGDGYNIEDFASYEDALVIAKRNGLWLLSGSGPDDFALSKIPGGEGFPGRCLCVTPYGLVIAGPTKVYAWQGGGVETISRPIENTYSLSGDFVSCAYADDVVKICDEGTGTIYAFNFFTGTWHVEKVTTHVPACVYAHENYVLYGPLSSTTYGPLAYSTHPNATRSRDASVAETFKAYTPELWPEGPERRITPKDLYVRVRQRAGTSANTKITMTPIYDGVPGTAIDAIQATNALTMHDGGSEQTWQKHLSLGEKKGVGSVQFQFTHTVASTESNTCDIEEVTLFYDVENNVT